MKKINVKAILFNVAIVASVAVSLTSGIKIN
ncbi:hypothetical protein SAMN05880570_4123 [Paenibacillus sp. RU4T]|nr:hypothetical protein SAMN05880555_4121 [Paenibacillus sp. RU4X]SIR61299.1 hypothetical protein SAMN05880570_4123 [Paenibacillus sp. RU4T]